MPHFPLLFFRMILNVCGRPVLPFKLIILVVPGWDAGIPFTGSEIPGPSPAPADMAGRGGGGRGVVWLLTAAAAEGATCDDDALAHDGGDVSVVTAGAIQGRCETRSEGVENREHHLDYSGRVE